tara:strand:+ start:1228 stop:1419 length:192 start_codon:yes stop_codon:yes gene_type:complete
MSELIINTQNPNEVKVILNEQETSLYFDRVLEWSYIMGKPDAKSDGKNDGKRSSNLSDMVDYR